MQLIRHLDVRLIRAIDEQANCYIDIRRIEFIHSQLMGAATAEDLVYISIIIDNHRRHVTLANVRQRNRCTLGNIHGSEAIERIAVHADNSLLIERRGQPNMIKFVHAPGDFHHSRELNIILNMDEIINVHCHGVSGRSNCGSNDKRTHKCKA